MNKKCFIIVLKYVLFAISLKLICFNKKNILLLVTFKNQKNKKTINKKVMCGLYLFYSLVFYYLKVIVELENIKKNLKKTKHKSSKCQGAFHTKKRRKKSPLTY